MSLASFDFGDASWQMVLIALIETINPDAFKLPGNFAR
jgi:hypothetical protein